MDNQLSKKKAWWVVIYVCTLAAMVSTALYAFIKVPAPPPPPPPPNTFEPSGKVFHVGEPYGSFFSDCRNVIVQGMPCIYCTSWGETSSGIALTCDWSKHQ